MESRIASREAMQDGTLAKGGSEYVIRSLPASEQLRTRSCVRCKGLLVNEWYYDLHNTGDRNVETLRCVQCGHRVDTVILQNRIRPPVESQLVRQVRQRSSAKTVVFGEDT
jgi:Zn ribbon nucleic-acid-binding protein